MDRAERTHALDMVEATGQAAYGFGHFAVFGHGAVDVVRLHLGARRQRRFGDRHGRRLGARRSFGSVDPTADVLGQRQHHLAGRVGCVLDLPDQEIVLIRSHRSQILLSWNSIGESPLFVRIKTTCSSSMRAR